MSKITPGALQANVQLFGPQGSDTVMIDNYIPRSMLFENLHETGTYSCN